MKKYTEWKNEKEEIKDGDILEGTYDNNVKCVVTNLCPDNMAYLVFDDGTTGICDLDNFKKTGRHIDIDSFLKQIGGEEQLMVIKALCVLLVSIMAYQWGYADGKRKERDYIEELLEAYREYYAVTIPILLDTHKAGEQE